MKLYKIRPDSLFNCMSTNWLVLKFVTMCVCDRVTISRIKWPNKGVSATPDQRHPPRFLF